MSSVRRVVCSALANTKNARRRSDSWSKRGRWSREGMLLLGFTLFLVWVVVHEIEMSESDTESG